MQRLLFFALIHLALSRRGPPVNHLVPRNEDDFAEPPLSVKKSTSDHDDHIRPPPPFDREAVLARTVIHRTGYVSLATISTRNGSEGYPYVNTKLISDGPEKNGTGNLYLYMSDKDVSQQDIEKDNRCTISATLATTEICEKVKYSHHDHRCNKVIFTGRLNKVKDLEEYFFAKTALFEKHPSLKNLPDGSGYFVSKLDIEKIEVMDFLGGIQDLSKERYFK